MSNNCEFRNIYEVSRALQDAGLESASLIIGIDFTKSNEWTGRYSFDGMNLHTIANGITNPYQHVISIIGTALLEYDDDKKIPCFGFGDATTHDRKVFSFYHDGRPCHGVEGVLERYEQLVPHVTLSGPTSFAPLIYTAIDIVRQSGNQFHVLVIIADGQVTGEIGSNKRRWSQQEKGTIDAIVAASNYPLSIVMVGVGDGPWDVMDHFDDALPARKFDNFQFVNYTELCAEYKDPVERETAIAAEVLMEIPDQYACVKQMGAGRYPNVQRNSSYVVQPPGAQLFAGHQLAPPRGAKHKPVRISSAHGRMRTAGSTLYM
ncbi:hypothetical protein L7F22_063898 [Adiantum nelumboides]|nr:hypothetical protein [Adiantum nelumboides]